MVALFPDDPAASILGAIGWAGRRGLCRGQTTTGHHMAATCHDLNEPAWELFEGGGNLKKNEKLNSSAESVSSARAPSSVSTNRVKNSTPAKHFGDYGVGISVAPDLLARFSVICGDFIINMTLQDD